MGAGIPWSDVNLQKLEGTPPVWSASSSLSEVTSLTLEFFTLGSAMGEPGPALTLFHAAVYFFPVVLVTWLSNHTVYHVSI